MPKLENLAMYRHHWMSPIHISCQRHRRSVTDVTNSGNQALYYYDLLYAPQSFDVMSGAGLGEVPPAPPPPPPNALVAMLPSFVTPARIWNGICRRTMRDWNRVFAAWILPDR
jgi:hypothetical protein